MKTAAVFFADGFEDVEALTPVDYLRRAGINVITVGIKGKPYNDSMIVTSSHDVRLITDCSLEGYLREYGEKAPDCVICPGGSRGAENLSECEALLAHLEKAWNEKKIVAAICASPAVVLGKTNIPHGKKWTCYPGMDKESNPEYVGMYVNKTFVSDGNLVTARGAGASEEFAMELVRLLAGEESAEKIKKGTLQR
ncbi:MAG: DJ-1/PfpI family protein [Treponema sp.]|nr:DJ-1/PfpI family protein [Treponema sp.]